jgi:hypothetical protein
VLGELHLANNFFLLFVQLRHQLHLLIHHLIDVGLPFIHLSTR